MRTETAISDKSLLLAFLLSGAASLGYELLWIRLLGLALGSESLAVLGVLAGFFGGLALGAFALDGPVRRARRPAQLFVALEVLLAAFALASPYWLHWLASVLPARLGPSAGNNDTALSLVFSVGISAIALLPGTLCMGATLAALAEARRRVYPQDIEGRGLGRLYAANTFGATVGVLITTYLVLPRLGLAAGGVLLSGIGLVSAGLALYWNRGIIHRSDPASGSTSLGRPSRRDPRLKTPSKPRLLYLVIAGAGLAGLGMEIVSVQTLTQILQNTVYTFANMLAIYLASTAAGAWIYARMVTRTATGRPETITAVLLMALALSVVLVAAMLRASPAILETVAPEGATYARHLVGELVVAASIFLVPTMLMGALFSHVVGLLASRGVGKAYALNTLGSTLSPFLFGLWAVRALGYMAALFLVAFAYLGLFWVFTWFRRFRPAWPVGVTLAFIGAWVLGPSSLALIETPSGWKVLNQREGLMGVVIVTEQSESNAQGGKPLRQLQVNERFFMGGGQSFAARRMGHIPMLLAPDARNVLVLGVGTGATLGATRSYPIERVEAVEIVPEVLESLHYFDDLNDLVRMDTRINLHAADARRYLAASTERFDVIIADLFHPARDGASSLFSTEHFEAVRDHLSYGGLFAQWLPLYQLDEVTLMTVVRTFLTVFPEVHSFLGVYNAHTPVLVLIGRVPPAAGEGLNVELGRVADTLREPGYPGLFIQDPRDLLGAYMLDRDGLAAYAGAGPLNTDLGPRVLFDAPRYAYEDAAELTYGSLASLLPLRTLYPEDLIVDPDPQQRAAFRAQVELFSRAVGYYLEGEILHVRSGLDANPPPAAVERYLAAYETEPDFAPARGKLYTIAAQNPDSAEHIYPHMLARTPDDMRVYVAYLEYFERVGDEEGYEALMKLALERFGVETLTFP